MVSLAPNAPSPLEYTVERPRKPHRQPRHAARKRGLVVRLDDHVDVVGLNRKLNHAKPGPGRPRERAPDSQEQRLLTQTRQQARPPHGHVHRMASSMQWS